ncbi:hypothetical protein Tamer19_62610 [Cupriavidus sp. TA19]|uniref:hypothetical protein n=1 Tax=Cupriavidus sp. TA19 TaxID=701108 RepID=UPI0027294627|nr:hypothetical protein [Cupriavidus sp. TA19]GLC96852.1 hypothetical protein Tamer19_62610 [Cupriavidus sp. TA19]
MQLQISTYGYDGEKPELQGHGHVDVRGEGVNAMFHFGATYDNSREDAEAQARAFVAAMKGEQKSAEVQRAARIVAAAREFVARIQAEGDDQ